MTLTALRQLSQTESFYVDLQISIQAVAHLTGRIDITLMQQALQHLAKRHPLLGAAITRHEGQWTFIINKNSTPPLEVLQEKISSDDYQRLLQQDFNQPLTITESLWRAKLIFNEAKENSSVLLLMLHHAVADGMCTANLVEEILKTYTELANGKTPSLEKLSLLPDIETLVASFIDPNSLPTYIQEHQKHAENINAMILPPLKMQEGITPEVLFLQKKFDAETTQKFITLCRQQGSSLHGLLCAVHLLALRELLPVAPGETITLCCHSPVDIRSRMKPPLSAAPMFSAAIGTPSCQKIEANTSLWDIAKSIKQDIQQAVETEDVFRGLLTFHETRAKSKLPMAMALSNFIIKTTSRYDEVLLEDIYCMPVIRVPMLAVTASTFAGELRLSYPYIPASYPTTLMQSWLEKIILKLSLLG